MCTILLTGRNIYSDTPNIHGTKGHSSTVICTESIESHNSRVAFIPKPKRNDSEAKALRTATLMSFMIRAQEKLLDYFTNMCLLMK